MARKKLLTEGEIRHFMKLANLTPLTETYLSEQPEMEMDLDVEEGTPFYRCIDAKTVSEEIN